MAELSDDAVFRANFDKKNKAYHDGDPTPVPLGGTRVPDQMKDHANWKDMPITDVPPPVIDYGAEYNALRETRNHVGDLKKAINCVIPTVETLVKLRMRKNVKESSISEQEQTRDTKIEAVKSFSEKFSEDSEEAKLIQEVCAMSSKLMDSTEYQEYTRVTKLATQQLFRRQKQLLDMMKEEKKKVK